MNLEKEREGSGIEECNERVVCLLVSVFVERAIGERQYVSSQRFIQREFLIFLRLNLIDKL